MVTDDAIQNYHSLRPAEFDILARLEVREVLNPGEPPELMLEMELLNEARSTRLLLKFVDVSQLRIQQPQLSRFQIGLIEIRSIRDWQWEGINYKVKSEEDEISLLCKSFEAKIH